MTGARINIPRPGGNIAAPVAKGRINGNAQTQPVSRRLFGARLFRASRGNRRLDHDLGGEPATDLGAGFLRAGESSPQLLEPDPARGRRDQPRRQAGPSGDLQPLWNDAARTRRRACSARRRQRSHQGRLGSRRHLRRQARRHRPARRGVDQRSRQIRGRAAQQARRQPLFPGRRPRHDLPLGGARDGLYQRGQYDRGLLDQADQHDDGKGVPERHPGRCAAGRARGRRLRRFHHRRRRLEGRSGTPLAGFPRAPPRRGRRAGGGRQRGHFGRAAC